MRRENKNREDKLWRRNRSSSAFLLLLVAGFAICAISTFMMVFSLYGESVDLKLAKQAFPVLLLSVAVIAFAVFLYEKEKDTIAEANKKKALEKLSVGITHDFNNILACFETYAVFLSEDLDEASKQHDFAKKILEANERARELIANIHSNPEIYEE